MILAAFSALCVRPIASTKSPSGSGFAVSYLTEIGNTFQKRKSSSQVHELGMGKHIGGKQQRTHQIEINTMIHQIIHPRLDPLRRTEIHPIQLADRLDLLPRARQADHVRMELFQIGLEHRRRVSCRITRYEEGEEGRVLGIAGGQSLVDEIEHAGHLVEFFGADVGTVREAEVDLVARAGCQRFPNTITLIRSPGLQILSIAVVPPTIFLSATHNSPPYSQV